MTLLTDVLDLNDNIWKWIKDFFDVQVALFAFEYPEQFFHRHTTLLR